MFTNNQGINEIHPIHLLGEAIFVVNYLCSFVNIRAIRGVYGFKDNSVR